jgi:hypothetical protein
LPFEICDEGCSQARSKRSRNSGRAIPTAPIGRQIHQNGERPSFPGGDRAFFILN